jgi:hypothetical protein
MAAPILQADSSLIATGYEFQSTIFLNKVVPEDEVLDKERLPKVKMPIGDDYGRLPDWKPRTRRLEGYPY